MNEKSYNYWYSSTDQAVSAHIGAFIKHHRLAQNKTQDELATAAGMSRSTLSLLERGETVTLATLIQVLRVLELLHVLEVFTITQRVSPLALAKAERKQRKRARNGSDTDSKKLIL